MSTSQDIYVKTCHKCKEQKILSCFYVNRSKSMGLDNCCKVCKSEDDRRYREKNKEKLSLRYKKYYQDNKARIQAKTKEYAGINREKIIALRAEYYRRNKSRWSKYNTEKSKSDPVFKAKSSIRKMLIKVLNGHKTKRSEEILGCSYDFFVNYIESKFQPWMTWDNKGKYNGDFDYGWDIDHIVPLCTAKSVEDIVRLNHYTNLQPLCSHVNRNIKRDKYE